MNDNELVKCIQDGDQQAVAEFYTRYHDLIAFKVSKKLNREHQDFKDVVQDIILFILSGLTRGKFDPAKGKLGAWIHGITRNQIAAYFHSFSKEVADKNIEIENLMIKAQSTHAIEQEEESEMIQKLLKKLKPQYQEVLMLRYFEELSIAEISEKINLEPRRVSERIHYALVLLRKQLQKGSNFFNK